MILSEAAIYFWDHMANRKLQFTHIFQYQEQVLYHILPDKKKIQSIVWKYSQIQSYMNANHLKLGTICISSIYYNLKLFYSLIYIFEVFIFFFLSLKCYFDKDKSSPLFFFFFCPTTQHVELLQPGIEHVSLHWTHSALTTGLPGKSKFLSINHRASTQNTSQNIKICSVRESVPWF